MNTSFLGKVLQQVSLAEYNTWRVGGKAHRLYKPLSIRDLVHCLQHLPPEEPLLWIGLGSNSLIRDGGFPGTVIVTQGGLKDIQVQGDYVRVEAGVSCATMARFCARNHFSGGEFWAGIPGTMGGALRMNAGCAGHETWQFVEKVETITRDGCIRVKEPKDFSIAYRHVSGLAEEEWFVAAICRLPKGEKETSLARMKELLIQRASTQPTNEFNCGSVFRNPPSGFAAQLIEACGLKGRQIGGALVSNKHANFIINQGNASAQDIESLIQLVQQTVQKEKQVSLIQEVHIIGEP